MAWILLPVALAAGVVLPVQFAVNSHLTNFGHGSAAAVSFVVGTIALSVAALVVRRSLPEPGAFFGASSQPCGSS